MAKERSMVFARLIRSTRPWGWLLGLAVLGVFSAPAGAQDVDIEDPEIAAIAAQADQMIPDNGREVSEEELEKYRQQVQSMMVSGNPESAPIDGMSQFFGQSLKTLQSMDKEALKKHLAQTVRFKKFKLEDYPKLLNFMVEVVTDKELAKSLDVDPQKYFKKLIYFVILLVATFLVGAIWKHRDQKRPYLTLGTSIKCALVRGLVINGVRLIGVIYIFREQTLPLMRIARQTLF